MRIGIDFDNTIAIYDDAFVHTAKSIGLLADDFSGGKREVRDAIRKLDNGEEKWQRLQGKVYGEGMPKACLANGIDHFLNHCRDNHIDVFIISHKTEYGHYDENRINLRDASSTWMEENKFFAADGFSIAKERVYFEDTREEKLARIAELRCDYFIDDLEEVLTAPGFPQEVKRCLYHPGDAAYPEGPFNTFKNWHEISRSILDASQTDLTETEDIQNVVETIINSKCSELQPVYTGVNSCLYKTSCDDRDYAVKQYHQQLTQDKQSRINREFNASQFMKQNGIDFVPTPIAVDENARVAVFEWIDGERITDPDAHDIDQLCTFIKKLYSLSKKSEALKQPLAAEACLSGSELIKQVNTRIEKLSGCCEGTEVADFINQDLNQSLEKFSNVAQTGYKELNQGFDTELNKVDCILSPSDFGFHNALRKQDGTLVFIDFEYFGWDDPVKLIADFVLHPGMNLSLDLKQYYIESMCRIFSPNKDLLTRLKLLLPLYGLRWCTIILNAFLPDYFTGNRKPDCNPETFKTRQLEKSQTLFNSLDSLPQLILENNNYYDAA